MPLDANQFVLRERLQFFLNTLHPVLREDLRNAFAEPGKLLFDQDEDMEKPSSTGVWPKLTLLIAQYLASDIDTRSACDIAVAVECFICALDILDDVEDGDQTPLITRIGVARALNISTTLLILTHHMLLSLSEIGVPPTRIMSLLHAFEEAALAATAGQHRDILAEQRPAESFTSEECIEIAAGKAGSLMSLACRVGALCANANAEVLAQFAELGKLLGIAHQLDNDSHDLYHILQYQQTGESQGIVKTDLVRQKKTLPVVLAAHTLMTLQHTLPTTDEEKKRVFNDALHEGIITTWGISLLYRERAHDILRQIEVQQPISQELRLLLNFT